MFKPKRKTTALLVAFLLALSVPVSALGSEFVATVQRAFSTSVTLVDDEDSVKTISLNLGEDETCRNITWYSSSAASQAEVHYAVKNGSEFPSTYEIAIANVNEDTLANGCAGFKYCDATLKNLAPDTEYVYRLVNGNTTSKTYNFSTNPTGDFSFIFLSDPQIGASGTENSDTSIENDGAAWANAIDKIMSGFPNSHFVISGGDQVNNGGYESEYAQFFAPDIMSSIAMSAVAGNHDDLPNYSQHFNNPNSSSLGSSAAGEGDFWYVYNDVLFLNLNSNSENLVEHKTFLEDAIAQNPHVLWKVVVFHHSIFSTTYHSTEINVVRLREFLVPVLTELDIDAVFMGHDHIYVRSYMMNEFTPDTSAGVQSFVTDPSGILYITSGSVTGSKYYNITNPDAEYVAVTAAQRPTFLNVEISSTSFKVSTYYVDDMSLLDKFEIKKSISTSLEHTPRYVVEKAPNCTQGGNSAYYYCDCGKYFEDKACTKEIVDKNLIFFDALGHQNVAYYARVPANCTKDGNIEHWHCNKCNVCFKDEGLSEPIDDVTIKSRGKHSGGETYYSDKYHWTLCEHCAEPYNREEHTDVCNCGYEAE